MGFANDFVWGVATASYQIEGAAYEGDKGLNGWDVGCETKGRVFEGHSGAVGCDHFHHMKEDVALLQRMGVKNYRFSLNWARIMPHGTGKISQSGVNFYLDLLKELRRAGITPWVTLFHWDYPYEVQQKGGWMNPESPQWFADYCRVAAELFGDLAQREVLFIVQAEHLLLPLRQQPAVKGAQGADFNALFQPLRPGAFLRVHGPLLPPSILLV